MKRSEFLKNIGLSTTGLLLPSEMATIHPLKIYDNYVRELAHYQYKKAKLHIKAGDTVTLRRDQVNAHGSFTIEVIYEELKPGYLTAYENIALANMMDAA